MARDDCQNAFARAAADHGVVLDRAVVPWLNQRGHLGLPSEAEPARATLDAVFAVLGGNPAVQAAKRLTPLRGDFVDVASGTFVEVDEHQHFTSSRLLTLELYPAETTLGFDLAEYRDLCRQWAPRADCYYRTKPAAAFGDGDASAPTTTPSATW